MARSSRDICCAHPRRLTGVPVCTPPDDTRNPAALNGMACARRTTQLPSLRIQGSKRGRSFRGRFGSGAGPESRSSSEFTLGLGHNLHDQFLGDKFPARDNGGRPRDDACSFLLALPEATDEAVAFPVAES
jgi:hypothetical protein